MFGQTRAIEILRVLEKRKKVIQGGTWGGKTESIIAILSQHLVKDQTMDCTVVAETIPALKGGSLKIFKKLLTQTHRWNEECYNYTDRIYKFPKGGTINFQAFDSVSKAKNAGKRTHLFINEYRRYNF